MGDDSGADLKGLMMRVAKAVLMAMVACAANVHAATVVVNGGASMLQSASGEEKQLSSLRVDCASYNRTNVGFLCGFDDGQHTVLQFEEREGMPVRLYDAEGREIAGVRRIGSYHVLPQLYRMIFVKVGTKEAVLLRGHGNFVETSQGAQGVAPAAVQAGRPVVGAVTVPQAAPVPAAQPAPRRALAAIKKGERIDLGLQALAASEGWEFLWYPSKSWKAISDIDLSHYKDAADAVSDVIDGLRDEGKPVQARISEGNKVIEILSTEVKND